MLICLKIPWIVSVLVYHCNVTNIDLKIHATGI